MPVKAHSATRAKLRRVLFSAAEGDSAVPGPAKPMQIELHKTVAAKPQAVFRTIADIVNWPQIIRSVAAVELLTHGRVRVGTRVRLTGSYAATR